MKVLVTGGAGYIGSHACKALAQAGHEPIVFDNLVHGHRWAVQWGPLDVGDLLDTDRLDRAFRTHKPDAVMHFAAYAYVGESVTDPAKYYRNNVQGSLDLLDAMRRHGVGRIVFSSTCATYGHPQTIPLREDHPQQPINPYGASKLMVERILADYAAAYGMAATALRYFNAAGADPDGDIGEAHSPETHLIPLVLDAIRGTGRPLTVNGTDYDTPDGTCIRDYIHVTDLAQAHVLALEASDPSATGRLSAYNLGNGNGFSIRDVIHAAERVTGKPAPTTPGPRRPGDPAVLVGDAAKIRTALHWQPQYANLDTIIQTAWHWQTRHPNLKPKT